MTDSDERISARPKIEEQSASTSYVYPIKSLLTGIQPAPDQRLNSSFSFSSASSSSSPEFTRWIADEVERAHDTNNTDGGNTACDPNTSNADMSAPRVRSKRSQSTTMTPTRQIHERKAIAKSLSISEHPLPNFRHFPGEDQTSQRPFARNPSGMSQEPLSPTSADPILPDVVEDSFDYDDPRHPPPLPMVSQEAFSTTSPILHAVPTSAEPSRSPSPADLAPSLPFNPAELGLVHLGPSSVSGSLLSSGTSVASSHYYTPQNSSSELGSTNNSSDPSTEYTARPPDQPDDVTEPGGSQSSASRAPSRISSASLSDSQKSDSALLTVRFQAVEDENGHHVVIGREGVLAKCEDEPIRTPGAVQGFGVLIAVEQVEDTLVVRQVSENSTEILGLSPRYLFSLECFTDTLPEDQASLLWDNVDFLAEPDGSATGDESEQDFNHPFRLSGWGAPPDPSDHSAKRQSWMCWCAMHRPPHSPTGRNSRLFVMEFELEKDFLNPLYPPVPSPPLSKSGTLSPTSNVSADSGGNSTDGSERTLVTGDYAQLVTTADSRTPTPSSSNVALGGTGDSTSSLAGLQGDESWIPSAEDIMESTTARSKPLLALERLRRITRAQGAASSPSQDSRGRRGTRNGAPPPGGGMMDVFAVMAQINEQLGAAPDLDAFLKVVVGVIKDLTQFHRVLVYQFDEIWNGQVVAELVDWSMTHDLYKGLHFPAGDIPAQARQLYMINKVRILYDRDQPTARIVVRSKEDLEEPLDMTHCYLRAMSPIHIKYLGNMSVRASMSVSIMAFGTLWGLVACHSYGPHGMRVSFPVRAMLKLLTQSISRNIERLSYAQRLKTRKLINTMASDNHPTGYIVSNADDLLGLFDADFGILVIGDGAKILGPNQHGQETLIMAEYLRLKQFDNIQASQAVTSDYPDLNMSTGMTVVAGLLYVPLSSGGKDFIAFLRKGQPREVHWAGKPMKGASDPVLEPRKSFKIWSETVAGRCRAWTDEQLETAGVLALVYGKFIEVWRQKENALQATKLTSLLLSNASHEVRTPLNHIINYLEMALNGPLDGETRDNLNRSHIASKSLLFTINDLLDLTRLESGQETSFNEPFNLQQAIEEAVNSYKHEAERRSLEFILDISSGPSDVVGDSKKIQTVVQNLTANALKYTTKGSITVCCTPLREPEGLRSSQQTAVEIVVADTGCGIHTEKLESIFREFEQVESSHTVNSSDAGVGLGLAVVARIVEQLGGQLRVDSKVEHGSRFSFLIPLAINTDGSEISTSTSSKNSSRSSLSLHIRSRAPSVKSGNQIDSLVEALSSNHMSSSSPGPGDDRPGQTSLRTRRSVGSFEVTDSSIPLRPIKVDDFETDTPAARPPIFAPASPAKRSTVTPMAKPTPLLSATKLRVLIVEDNIMNLTILAKRLTLSGHTVVNTMNGQEALDLIRVDREFDCILMDLNMPILDGYEASLKIREVEQQSLLDGSTPQPPRLSGQLNGRIPIFAVSASCVESQRERLSNSGMDGWILKPLNFKRLAVILMGITDLSQREADLYHTGCNWESGGWLRDHNSLTKEGSSQEVHREKEQPTGASAV